MRLQRLGTLNPMFDKARSDALKQQLRKANDEEYRAKYVGQMATVDFNTAPKGVAGLLAEDGLVDGRQYEITNVWYEPRNVPDVPVRGLEDAISVVREPYLVLEVLVDGNKKQLGGYLFGIKPDA